MPTAHLERKDIVLSVVLFTELSVLSLSILASFITFSKDLALSSKFLVFVHHMRSFSYIVPASLIQYLHTPFSVLWFLYTQAFKRMLPPRAFATKIYTIF